MNAITMNASPPGFGTSMSPICNPLALRNSDGFLRQYIGRNINGAQYFGHMRVPAVSVTREMDQMDVVINSQIHSIEKEAYAAVLRSFSAQSDSISFDKLPLISELRKELRVSDLEQRELVSGIELDDTIMEIRQKRKHNTVQQSLLSNTKKTSVTLLPSSHDNSFDKKMRNALVSKPLLPMYHSHAQQPALVAVGTHGNEQWGRDQLVSTQDRDIFKPVASNKLLLSMYGGRSLILTRNIFPNPCVNSFKKESYVFQVPATDQIILEAARTNMVGRCLLNAQALWLSKCLSEEMFQAVRHHLGDEISIIERIFKTGNPEPAAIEKTKLLLNNCEEALVEAIDKINDIMDEDDTPVQQYYEAPILRNGKWMHSIVYSQVD